MSVFISVYDQTLAKLVNQDVDLSSLKLMLLDATAVFDGAHAALNDVAGVGHTKEVYGHGWTQGGMALSGVAAVVAGAHDATLAVDDLSVVATGGSIGAASSAVIYDGNAVPLFFIDFGSARTAATGTLFSITFDASGLLSFAF